MIPIPKAVCARPSLALTAYSTGSRDVAVRGSVLTSFVASSLLAGSFAAIW